VERLVRERLAHSLGRAPPPVARQRSIPTVYGGAWGPDLEEAAARLQMPPETLVARHTEQELVVYMLGFSPGFPYLGDLPPELALPRRAQPRERVPVGSVAIAERQTGIYSRETPGGWHLLGRTPIVLFDEQRTPPAYLAPGDHVRFVAIPAEAWDAHAGPPADW
jgi:inhibitor of KinA